ncbi:hypothetical protein ACKFKG_12375 [Phormidesmis sp. 146-35]
MTSILHEGWRLKPHLLERSLPCSLEKVAGILNAFKYFITATSGIFW